MPTTTSLRIVSLIASLIIRNDAAAQENCGENGICINTSVKRAFWQDGREHGLACDGRIEIGNDENTDLMVKWVLKESQRIPIVLAKWRETLRKRNGTIFIERKDIWSNFSVRLIAPNASHDSYLSWGIMLKDFFSVGDDERVAECQLEDVGVAIVHVKSAIVPSQLHIIGGEPITAETRRTFENFESRVTSSIGLGGVVQVAAEQMVPISCLTNGYPQPLVTWALNEKTIDPSRSTMTEMIKTSNPLWLSHLITKFEKSDQNSILSCSAQVRTADGDSSLIITRVLVRVSFAPVFAEVRPVSGFTTNGNATAREGRKIELRCETDCEGSCRFEWHTGSKSRVGQGRQLVIEKTSRTLNPDYTCRVTSEKGSVDSKPFRVRIVWPPLGPRISILPKEQGEEDLQLKCSSSEFGNPPAKIQWLMTSLMNSTMTSEGENLTIPAAANTTYITRVTCVMKNEVGMTSSSLLVAVKSARNRIPWNKLLDCESVEDNDEDVDELKNEKENVFFSSSGQVLAGEASSSSISGGGNSKSDAIKRLRCFYVEDGGISGESMNETQGKALKKPIYIRIGQREKVMGKEGKTAEKPKVGGRTGQTGPRRAQNKNRIKIRNRSQMEITIAIVVVGLIICSALIAMAMRCSINENDETDNLSARTCEQHKEATPLRKSPPNVMDKMGTEIPVEKEETQEKFEIRGPLCSSELVPPRDSDMSHIMEKSDDIAKGEVEDDRVSLRSVELTKSCQLIGDYVEDVNAFFNILDDLTRALDSERGDGMASEPLQGAESVEIITKSGTDKNVINDNSCA